MNPNKLISRLSEAGQKHLRAGTTSRRLGVGERGVLHGLKDATIVKRPSFARDARWARGPRSAAQTTKQIGGEIMSKKSGYNEAVFSAFADEIEKQAFVGAALGAVGRGVLGAAKKWSPTKNLATRAVGMGRKMTGSTAGAQKLVGGATLGAGALGAAGLGAGLSRRQGQ